MAGGNEIDSLPLRKQALLLESHLNRLTLEAEWQNLQAATAWVKETTQTCRQLRPWLGLLAPLAGFLAVRGMRQPDTTLRRLLSVARWMLRLRNVWKDFSSRPASSGPE